jgi:hypothetical protein
LQQLVAYLVKTGGEWGVTLRIGVAPGIPREVAVTADNVFEHIDTTEAYEPPAVYRLTERALPNRWEGESHSWRRLLEAGVAESVSFNRPRDDMPENGGWFAQLNFEIREPL